MRFAVLLFAALTASADSFDAHRVAVLDQLLRELPEKAREGGVFVRATDECTSEARRQPGCIDLTDEVLDELTRRGHNVARVPEGSRYYIYGHPSTHGDEFNPPPPDWSYLPQYTPGAESRTYCEVRVLPSWGIGPEFVHLNGYCVARERSDIYTSGDFKVRREGVVTGVERFEPPPGCVLPMPDKP